MIVFKNIKLHSKRILCKYYVFENRERAKCLFPKRHDGYIDKGNVLLEHDKIFENRLHRIQEAKDDII